MVYADVKKRMISYLFLIVIWRPWTQHFLKKYTHRTISIVLIFKPLSFPIYIYIYMYQFAIYIYIYIYNCVYIILRYKSNNTILYRNLINELSWQSTRSMLYCVSPPRTGNMISTNGWCSNVIINGTSTSLL